MNRSLQESNVWRNVVLCVTPVACVASGSCTSDGESEPAGEAGGMGGDGGEPGVAAPRPPESTIEYDGLNGVVKNPIISHIFTADPSAKVFGDRIYLYASHDLDDQDGYEMVDYHVFSTNDLVNWQDHGVVLDVVDIPWAWNLYAPDACYSESTGKYYLYFPNGGTNIGVAVADDPAGPFEDALGGPLVTRQTPGAEEVDWVFDPGCFVDDDGQAYLYFGGGMPDTGDNARVVRLGEDMISLLDEPATTIVAPDFFEAAFMHKRGDVYYFSYSTTFSTGTASIDYMTSESPISGFEYAGTVLPNPAGNNNGNHHHSIIDYEGKSYIFFHNRVLSDRDGYSSYQRSVTLDELTYDSDGDIVEMSPTFGEVHQLRHLDAFSLLQAETMADQRGIEVDFAQEDGERVGVAIVDIHDEDWIGYSQVDFGQGATHLTARVATSDEETGGEIHVFVDGADVFSNLMGRFIGTCSVPTTGGAEIWVDAECDIQRTEGVHDVYLRFAGEGEDALLRLDSFRFD